MDELHVDEVSRIALIALRSGRAATLEEAEAQIERRTITIVASSDSPDSRDWQAAAIVAVELAVRCFGTVTLATDWGDAPVVAGPRRGMTVADAARAAGAVVVAIEDSPITDVAVIIGKGFAAVHAICATWSGWVARAEPISIGQAASCTGGNVIAAIAAAALAVGDAFHYLLDIPGSDAGHRVVELDLWGPGPAPITLEFAPADWWLVGLGHLGQANAFVISHLPYTAPPDVELMLQDIDVSSVANHGTSVLTPRDAKAPKTRLAAAALENAGFRTRIVERPMSLETSPASAESGHVALIGVDNLETRRLISAMGWSYAIDAGLGHTIANYQSISLHAFPSSERSDQVKAWQDSERPEATMPDSPGFADLARRFERCGVVELAGKAVAVPFVGMVAAALAVAMAVREVSGGGVLEARRFDLGTLDRAFGHESQERIWAINAYSLG